jgi:(S)-ureidoglycine aminohydrolase
MPLEGYPFSRLPGWPGCDVRVLASPALGAKFVQYLIDLPAGARGGFAGDEGIETFSYVISGKGEHRDGPRAGRAIAAGSFSLSPPAVANEFSAVEPMRLMIFQKRYQPSPGIEMFKALVGRESEVAAAPWADTDKIKLQTLVPDDLQYDMAMNIFTFTPGFGLPIVETHVMEHGLLFLQGKGVYRLGDEWMEVEKDDFIWMGPYCPQSFYAAGEQPARYIYYKDVNREIPL